LKDGGRREALTELGAALAQRTGGGTGNQMSGGLEVQEEASVHTFGYLREDGRQRSGQSLASSKSGQHCWSRAFVRERKKEKTPHRGALIGARRERLEGGRLWHTRHQAVVAGAQQHCQQCMVIWQSCDAGRGFDPVFRPIKQSPFFIY
jgi:hypothetical protein